MDRQRNRRVKPVGAEELRRSTLAPSDILGAFVATHLLRELQIRADGDRRQ